MISPRQLTRGEDGQDLLEYGLLASLIAIAALFAVRLVATQITDVLWGAIAIIDF
jgi:Flp pilus assembly pilin Flp